MNKFILTTAFIFASIPTFANENMDFCMGAYEASNDDSQPEPTQESCDCIVNAMEDTLSPEINAGMRKMMLEPSMEEKQKIMFPMMSNPEFVPSMEKFSAASEKCPI